MKKMITMLSLGILIAGSSFAQNAPKKDDRYYSQQEGERARRQESERGREQRERKSPEEMASDRTSRLDKQLDLSNSQEKRVYALFLQQGREMQQNRDGRQDGQRRDGQGRDGRNKDFRNDDRGRYDAELKKILNKKQYAKLEANRQEMRSRNDDRDQKRGQDFKGKSQRQRQNS